MKKQQKQHETDSTPMPQLETVKSRGKKVNGKRKHNRSFYMAVNPKGGAIPGKNQLPVFWRKSLAKEVARKVNGRVEKVIMSW